MDKQILQPVTKKWESKANNPELIMVVVKNVQFQKRVLRKIKEYCSSGKEREFIPS